MKQPNAPKILWSAPDPLTYEDAETVLPLDGNRLLVGTRDLFSFDVSDPAQPKRLAALKDRPPVDIVNGVTRLGNVVFAANKQGYIFAVDVSARAPIELLGKSRCAWKPILGRGTKGSRRCWWKSTPT